MNKVIKFIKYGLLFVVLGGGSIVAYFGLLTALFNAGLSPITVAALLLFIIGGTVAVLVDNVT